MDLVNGPVAKTLVLFSFPFVFSTLLQTLYSTTDTIVVGQVLGSSGLAAVANASQLMQIAYMLVIGFSTAGQVLIAQASGAGKTEKLQQVIGTLFWLEVIMCLLASFICAVFASQLLSLMGTPPEAYEQARWYVMVCGGGMIFTGFYNMFSAILRGMGDSRHPLLFVVIATAVNIVLDILFVAYFHWSVAGAALATVIGQAVSVLFSVVFFFQNEERLGLRLHVQDLRAERAAMRQIIELGIPMAFQSAAVAFSFLFVVSMVNTLGVHVSAAFGVMQKIRQIPGFITQGFGLGTASMIGQNLGANRKDRVSKCVLTCIGCSAVIDAMAGILYIFTPELCFQLFTQDRNVLSMAILCCTAMAIELPANVFMPACNNLVSAQGFVKLSFAVSLTDAFAGRVFLCWLLGIKLGFGAMGMFIGYIGGTYITSVIVSFYFFSGLWKKRSTLL